MFAIILDFPNQLFLIFWLEVWLRSVSPSRWFQLFIHLAFGYWIVLGLTKQMFSVSHLIIFGLIKQMFSIVHFIVLGLTFGLLLNCLFATLFGCNFKPLRNRSWLSLASLSSRLSVLPSNRVWFYVTVLNCPCLHRGVACWLAISVGRWVGRFFDLVCVNRSWLLAPWITSGSRQNLCFW